MKILSVNAGSSSLKFQMYEMPEEKVLISGVFERIGINGSFYTIKYNDEKIKKETELKDHKESFAILIKELIDYKIVENLNDIKGVGHRVVQGGSYFDKTVKVDEEVISKIDELSVLAPLHNPAAITGIRASIEVMPEAIQTVVFDTAFHQTMAEETYLYALPKEWAEKYKIRRYGAHGTSHKYVSARMNEILGRVNTKLITCHIGNGASISAIKDGKSVDTSMGFTPEEIDTILNKESGLLGISGISNDARDIEEGINKGNLDCILAQKMYVRRIIDYIAKYYVELGGCDAIVFTAGVGEKSISTRREVLDGLEVLGVVVDEEANFVRGIETKITKEESKIPAYIIPTDEELMIARDTYNLCI